MAALNSTQVNGKVTQSQPASDPHDLVRLAEAQQLAALTSVNGMTGVVVLNTSHLAEVTNLFFTAARVRATDLTGFSAATGAITAGDTVLSALGKTQGRLAVIEAWTTTNLTEGSNLYFTTARVRATDLTGFSAATGAITAADTLLSALGKTQGRLAVIEAWSTTNLAEGANLYFTNARARAAVSVTGPLTYNSGTGVLGCNAAVAATADTLVLRDSLGDCAVHDFTAAKILLPGVTLVNDGAWLQVTTGSAAGVSAELMRVKSLTGKEFYFGADIGFKYTGLVSGSPTTRNVGACYLHYDGSDHVAGLELYDFRLVNQVNAAVLGSDATGRVIAKTFTTTAVGEGSNLYFTTARVLATALAGFSATTGAITASDTVLSAFNKTQGRLAAIEAGSIGGAVSYQGAWNASTNSPALVSSVGVKGQYYVVSVAGATTLDGVSTWAANDWVVFNGTIWQRLGSYADAQARACVLTGFSATTGAITATDTVLSAFNKTQGRLAAAESWITNDFAPGVRATVLTGFAGAAGAITAADTVLTAFNKTVGRLAIVEAWTTANLPESGNLYYTDARVRACVLTGFSAGIAGGITATDTVLNALGKAQYQLNSLAAQASNSLASGSLVTAQISTPLLYLKESGGATAGLLVAASTTEVELQTQTLTVVADTKFELFNGVAGFAWLTTGYALGTTFAQPAAASGTPARIITVTAGAHTGLTASTEATDVQFNLARVVQFAAGALTEQRAIRITAPSYAFAGASTLSFASTVEISGAPTAWTNATLTNSAGLRIRNGAVATANTNAFGLYCEAPTGGANNFAALFHGSVVIGATPSMGGGVGVLFLANAGTNPGSNPTGGGVIYVDAGALKYRGSGGTVTTLGPA